MPAAAQPSPAAGISRRTAPSTTERGATCRRPSSGRSSRTNAAQRRSRSQARAGLSRTMPRTRPGSIRPASIATRPPMLLPATQARLTPSASSVSKAERANQAAS